MKKFFIAFLLLGLSSYCALAQTPPFVGYQPTFAEPQPFTPPTLPRMSNDPLGLSSPTPTPPSPQYREEVNYSTTSAYMIKNGQFHKIRIKIWERGNNIHIHSYYDKDTNMWYQAYNTLAERVTKFDRDIIYNNFDFKVYISQLGYVYF